MAAHRPPVSASVQMQAQMQVSPSAQVQVTQGSGSQQPPSKPPAQVASKLEAVSFTPKGEGMTLSESVQADVEFLSGKELAKLVADWAPLKDRPRRGARAASRMLLKACEGRRDLSASLLLEVGAPLPTIVQVAQRVNLSDLPPTAGLAKRLVEALQAWKPPSRSEEAAGGEPTSRVLLGGVKRLGLVQWLPKEAVMSLLERALGAEPGWLLMRRAAEGGDLVPEWRRGILEFLLDRCGKPVGDVGAKDLRGLVRLAQAWGAHTDPKIGAKLRELLESEESQGQAAPCAASQPSAPALQLDGEDVVLVKDKPSEAKLQAWTKAAMDAASAGEEVMVGMDAEWHDPRPLSLLQLAVSLAGASPVVFLVDMLAPPSAEAMRCCRQLLTPSFACHEVLAFSPKEDVRRLRLAGVLPALDDQRTVAAVGEAAVEGLAWVDMQQMEWGLGSMPSLRAVVLQEIGATMDKSLQTSNWDKRPLTQAQVVYAALDASVLLRLRRLRRRMRSVATQSAAVQTRSETDEERRPSQSSLEDERARWDAFRASAERQRKRSDEKGARAANADLAFVLPSALNRLLRKMRGLGLDTTIMQEGAPGRLMADTAEREDRVIITRSRKAPLPGRCAHRTYSLKGESVDEQLREVIETFQVAVDSQCLCGRCVHCNTWDWQLVTKDEVKDNPQISQKTLDTFDEYWKCGGCGKVYWEGNMYTKALGHFRSFMPGESESEASQSPLNNEEVMHKYREMEANGCSEHRIRAAMVRDGVLTPGEAAESRRHAGSGKGDGSSANASDAGGILTGTNGSESHMFPLEKEESLRKYREITEAMEKRFCAAKGGEGDPSSSPGLAPSPNAGNSPGGGSRRSSQGGGSSSATASDTGVHAGASASASTGAGASKGGVVPPLSALNNEEVFRKYREISRDMEAKLGGAKAREGDQTPSAASAASESMQRAGSNLSSLSGANAPGTSSRGHVMADVRAILAGAPANKMGPEASRSPFHDEDVMRKYREIATKVGTVTARDGDPATPPVTAEHPTPHISSERPTPRVSSERPTPRLTPRVSSERLTPRVSSERLTPHVAAASEHLAPCTSSEHVAPHVSSESRRRTGTSLGYGNNAMGLGNSGIAPEGESVLNLERVNEASEKKKRRRHKRSRDQGPPAVWFLLAFVVVIGFIWRMRSGGQRRHHAPVQRPAAAAASAGGVQPPAEPSSAAASQQSGQLRKPAGQAAR